MKGMRKYRAHNAAETAPEERLPDGSGPVDAERYGRIEDTEPSWRRTC